MSDSALIFAELDRTYTYRGKFYGPGLTRITLEMARLPRISPMVLGDGVEDRAGHDLNTPDPALPEDFPARALLIAAGLDSLEAVANYPGDLTDIKGIGQATASKIKAAL